MSNDIETGILKADGFDGAFLGVAEVNGSVVAVYSRDKSIDILMERDGMTEDGAIDFLDFNVINSYVGPQTPIWMTLCGLDYLDGFK